MMPTAPKWAWLVVLFLFVMHLLDSVDRWLLARSLPGSAMSSSFPRFRRAGCRPCCFSDWPRPALPIGYLADRLRRPRLLAMGFAIWSVATVATGLARSYDQIQVARALVGVGGATFEVVALTILMDLFPRAVRGPGARGFLPGGALGAALGLSLGAALAQVTGWQTAFLVVGAPGLMLAWWHWSCPTRCAARVRGSTSSGCGCTSSVGPSREDYIDLMVNSSYTYSVFGITFSSFALAGSGLLVADLPDRGQGVDGGPGRFAIGHDLSGRGDPGHGCRRLAGRPVRRRSTRERLFILPGLGMLAAIPFVLAAIYGRSVPWIFGGIVPRRGR